MRALKVVLENKSHRKFLLDNAKFIPVKAPQVFKKNRHCKGYDTRTKKGT